MKNIRRKAIWWLMGLAMILLAIALVICGPFISRVRLFAANPAEGFHADFYLYVSPRATQAARDGKAVTILVQPNNSGTNSDDPAVHRSDAWWTGFGRRSIADELGVILLVPAFIRPATDWQIYTHALDRDSMTTSRPDLARLDLQLIAMIDHSRSVLAANGMRVDRKVLIQGYSASGMFCNRFTALHPDRVLAAATGSPGGWPIAPLTHFSNEALPYPAGVADLATLTGEPFDAATFDLVPQLFVMGSLDENDSLDFRDGWGEESAALVDRLFGSDPQSRWKPAEDLYRSAGVQAQYLLVDGVGHNRRLLQHYSTDFFRKILDDRR